MKKARILFVFSILVLACVGNAQISSGGMPKSFQMNLADDQFETIAIQPPDLIQIGKDDSIASDQFLPRRFCVLLPVGVDLATAGTWTKMPDGSKIWRLKLKSEGALATSLVF